MFFRIASDVYLTYYNEEIIVLDLCKDRYLILQKDIADVVDFALKHEFQRIDEFYVPIYPPHKKPIPDRFDETIKTLREMRIIDTKDHLSPASFVLREKPFSAGVENIDWRISYGDLYLNVSKKLVFEAYMLRIKVSILLKIFGFASLIQSIKKAGRRKSLKRIDAQEYHVLTTALNRACFYYPVKTKCLEWASTLTLLAIRRGWQCNLIIGVQNTPFMAHAWVEANEMVVADTQNLPKDLAVILAEPFGKFHGHERVR